MCPVGYALAFAADDGFARPLAVTLYSALKSLATTSRPQVYVLDNGLSEESRARLRRIAAREGRGDDLHWTPVPKERLASLPSTPQLPIATYSRLLLPELLPSRLERVVYVDADVLVLKDLSPLFSLALGDAIVGAADDIWLSTADRPYRNAGVLVIDLPAWRRAGLAERALAHAGGQSTLRFADQDALNAVVGRWHTLDDRWNVQVGNIALAKRRLITDRQRYFEERRLYRSAAVLHYVGPKPWNPACQTIGTTRWAVALTRSGWYTRRDAVSWFAHWLAARAAAWPGIVRDRWRARLDAIRSSVA